MDLRRLGRNIKDVIIVDNSPVSFSLQPENAIPIKSWFDDSSDREL
jgi:RNA polymerase II subunit A small phosphatase-like protein